MTRYDLVVAANRGPVSVNVVNDELVIDKSQGGLAPSLVQALKGSGALWIASAMTEGERRANAMGATSGLLEGVELELLEFDPDQLYDAYNVIANQTLWYLHHEMFDPPRSPVFDAKWHRAWASYRAYNERFAAAIAERAAPDASVLVNDYHLALVGSPLSRLRPDLKTVFFTHTPFCGAEELAVFPEAVAHELMESMSSFGSCGFHNARWAENFLECSRHVLKASAECFIEPLGVDPAELQSWLHNADVKAHRQRIKALAGDRRLIVRSDRIEPSKNLTRGFLAFDEMLNDEPDLVDSCVFLARVYPSRSDLEDYRNYRAEIEALVTDINARHPSSAGDVIALEIGDDLPASLAALSCYDVLLVNAIRDGMNLVAKEGPVINENAGVLVLSTRAGAHDELEAGALCIEPFDVTATARALREALAMDASERATRAHSMAEASAMHPPALWLADVLEHARPVARRD